MSLLQPIFPTLSVALGKPKLLVHEKLKHPLRKSKYKYIFMHKIFIKKNCILNFINIINPLRLSQNNKKSAFFQIP